MYAVYSYLLERRARPVLARARQWRALLGLVVLLACFSPPAWAYLDPGTGSILLQGMIAAVAAAVTYAGLYWRKVKALFFRLIGRKLHEPRNDDRPSSDSEP